MLTISGDGAHTGDEVVISAITNNGLTKVMKFVVK
jgi:hypothetical protein